MSEPAVVLQGVVKRSAGKVSLDGVDATIAAGRWIGLLGPGGAGKTTLLRLLAGLLRPDAGRVTIFGHDTVRETAAVQAIIGYLPQRPGLHLTLTVMENLELHADLRNVTGDARRTRIGELLQLTDLAGSGASRASALAAGERWRLGLACALIGMPRLVLLDEPSATLDPPSHRRLLAIIGSLTARGMTVLLSTARFDQAQHCPEVILLNEGRIIASGSPMQIGAHLAGRVFFIPAIGAARRRIADQLWREPGIADVQVRGASVRFLTARPESDAGLHRFAAIGAAQAAAPRLEDRFLDLAGPSAPAPPTPRTSAAIGLAVEARGLGRRFGGTTVVDDVSFAVAPGNVFGLFGPSGAGKTTILRMLSGLLSPTIGAAACAGSDLRTAPQAARARLGYMGQKFSLYGELSVAQNLRFFAAAYKVERRRRGERVDKVLAEFGLEPHADTGSESLPPGLKQRLALAATLVHEPEVLLLDEPTAGVDPLTARDIWRRIDALAAGGIAIVVASRFLDEAEYCDRLLLLHRGRSIAAGRPDEIMATFADSGDGDATIEDTFAGLVADLERRKAA